MKIRIDLDETKIIKKVTNDRFGKFVSNEWKRMIDPYTPRYTGLLEESARLYPWEIHYTQKYASAVYDGKHMKFQKNNPYSTYEWDVKAAQSGQLNKLYRTLNDALEHGYF